MLALLGLGLLMFATFRVARDAEAPAVGAVVVALMLSMVFAGPLATLSCVFAGAAVGMAVERTGLLRIGLSCAGVLAAAAGVFLF